MSFDFTLDSALIIAIGVWLVGRLETICRKLEKIKKLLRQTHPKEYYKVFEN